MEEAINIIFSGDGPDLVFVEIETDDGKSINITDLQGKWDRRDGFWVLRIPPVVEERTWCRSYGYCECGSENKRLFTDDCDCECHTDVHAHQS